jgi:hypothetical protein
MGDGGRRTRKSTRQPDAVAVALLYTRPTSACPAWTAETTAREFSTSTARGSKAS